MIGLVRTVLGDLDPAGLGLTDAHEHVLIGPSWATYRDPDVLLDDEDAAADELAAFAAAGGGAVVDAMPSSCGRDADGLERVSRRTGIHIIATAGFHTADYYAPWHWYHNSEQDRLTRLVLDEVVDGFDRNDYLGPEVERTGIRPGLLKAAVGFHTLRPAEERALRAVADVQVESGLPMTLHVEHGADPFRGLNILLEHGVDPGRVALAHMDRNPDVNLHRRVLDAGAWLSYDGLHRERYRPESIVIDLLSHALDDRVLLGGDLARRSLRRESGGDGIAGFAGQWHRRVLDELGDGAETFFTANPARFLSVPIARPADSEPQHHQTGETA